MCKGEGAGRGGAGWREDAGVTSRCGLVHGLVGERARAGNDCDPAFLVDVAGHDPDLALARLDDARAVRPNQSRLRLHRNALLPPWKLRPNFGSIAIIEGSISSKASLDGPASSSPA